VPSFLVSSESLFQVALSKFSKREMLGLTKYFTKKKKLLQRDVAQHRDSSPSQSCCAKSFCKSFFFFLIVKYFLSLAFLF
jgi:hypothetical protein